MTYAFFRRRIVQNLLMINLQKVGMEIYFTVIQILVIARGVAILFSNTLYYTVNSTYADKAGRIALVNIVIDNTDSSLLNA